jgi:carboxypeptidase Taq
MGKHIAALKARTTDILNLKFAQQVLEWDMQAYMPPGGANARAEQIGLLSRITHETLISKNTARLLELGEKELNGAGPASDDALALREIRREYDRASRIPASLSAEMAHHSVISESVWRDARAADDFTRFAPYLKKSFDLARTAAQCYGYEDDPYDPLLDKFEPGAKARDIEAMFAELKTPLIELARKIAESAREAPTLEGRFPIDAQRELTVKIVQAIGYDLHRGRQDEAAHPFCTSFSRDDVRITTRFDESRLEAALYASLHEAGHALYEQGIAEDLKDSVLGESASMAVHESQSRLWENLVGRSRAFCDYLTPYLEEAFPEVLSGLNADSLFRSVNRVERSLIRVEADEVTYNLHVLLRFELERALLNETVSITDLPEVWNAKMREYLGIVPPDDKQGVLQDVHWAAGLIGYFPTYSLGNVMSGQIWAAIRKSIPNLDDQLAQGRFVELLGWLRENIHRHGRKYRPLELIARATGEPLAAGPYVNYLRTKYEDIYDLN